MAITLKQVKLGCEAYWANESRDAMYRVAVRLVEEWRDNPADVADAIGVILLTWNQAAYRYGTIDFELIERFIIQQRHILDSFENRSIRSFNMKDDGKTILALFDKTLDALVISGAERRSPVGASKALHILAPNFFPLWDGKIAKGTGYRWYRSDQASKKYIEFMDMVKNTVGRLDRKYATGPKVKGLPVAKDLAGALSKLGGRKKTILKFLDEYYYAKYTGRWVS